MPHLRQRICEKLILKRMKLWPVLGILGPRQSGKSTLLREVIAPKIKARYLTLDSESTRSRAERSPESMTAPQKKASTLILDEIQKEPSLFDAIKLHVDRKRVPGTYLITGSTEFSRYSGIRESLTGRIGIIRIYPMVISELLDTKPAPFWNGYKHYETRVTLEQFERKLERGGMPGFCFLRNPAEFEESVRMWLDTSCYRDLSGIGSGKFDGSLALEILGQAARSEEPTCATIAKKLKKDSRIIQRHLDALTRIFVLHRLNPHRSGVGKDHYVLCDSGIVSYFGGPLENKIRAHLLNEALSHLETNGFPPPFLRHYRNEKTARVPIIFEWPTGSRQLPSLAIQFSDSESISKSEMLSIQAFRKRVGKETRILYMTQTPQSHREDGIEMHPIR